MTKWATIPNAVSIAVAIKIAIDAIAQIQLRYKATKLDNQTKELELDKKRAEDAIDIANKMIDILGPKANAEMKSKMIEIMLPSLLQLSKSKGVQLVPQVLLSQKDEVLEVARDSSEADSIIVDPDV